MSLIHLFAFLCKNAFFIVAGLFGIGFIIGFHELGHFLFCKLFNIRTPSFSIGFGPKLFSKKIWGTEFSLSAIPVGGYVEVAGMAEVAQGEQKEAHSRDAHSIESKPWYQKMLVVLGGILFNLIFAYVTMVLLFMAGAPGSRMLYPLTESPTIETVARNSAAEKAGIKPGDTILAIDNKSITVDRGPIALSDSMTEHLKALRNKPNGQVELLVKRDAQNQTVPVTLDEQEIMGNKMGVLGVTFKTYDWPSLSLIDSFKYGIKVTNAYIVNTIYAFKYMFSKKDISQAGGPLMIISETAKSAGKGIKIFFLLLALISINLAVLNLIPLPILDGGQMFFYTIEAIAGRQVPAKVKEYIHIANWGLFMLLILYLSAKDIFGMIAPHIENIKGILGMQ
jgi:regulator of sigma E protease